MSESTDALRDHLVRVLDWEEAHVGFDKAVDGIPPEKRGALASGFEHSPWQLLEHMLAKPRRPISAPSCSWLITTPIMSANSSPSAEHSACGNRSDGPLWIQQSHAAAVVESPGRASALWALECRSCWISPNVTHPVTHAESAA